MTRTIHIVAPYTYANGVIGAAVLDSETGKPIPEVADIEISIPVHDIIRARIEINVARVDVKAEGEFVYVTHCKECGERVEIKRDTDP